jgi:putative endonuclease
MEQKTSKPYSLYLLLCRGNVIYAGITNDMERRYGQHTTGKGAKFTKSHPPIKILAQAVIGEKGEALKHEYTVKQLPRAKKASFVNHLSSQKRTI